MTPSTAKKPTGQTGSQLLFDANTLDGNCTYTYKATVSSSGITKTEQFTFKTTRGDILVYLDKGDGTISATSDFSVSAASSYDEDNRSNPLTFSW